MTMPKLNFDSYHVKGLASALRKIRTDHYASVGKAYDPSLLVCETSSKYIHIVDRNNSAESVCLVYREGGNIHRMRADFSAFHDIHGNVFADDFGASAFNSDGTLNRGMVIGRI